MLLGLGITGIGAWGGQGFMDFGVSGISDYPDSSRVEGPL